MGLPDFFDSAFAWSKSVTQAAFFRNSDSSFSSSYFFIASWSCARAAEGTKRARANAAGARFITAASFG